MYHVGQKFRSFNRWSQFLAMAIAQISSRKSLRDVVSNIGAQKQRIYHFGMRSTKRTTLARVNEQQPYQLYRDMFYKLLNRYRLHSLGHKSKFKGKVYPLDTTTIDLCLSVLPWATFRKAKGAIKLHFGIDADGYLPVFMNSDQPVLRFKAKLGISIRQILRILQLNLFDRRSIW